MRKPSRRELGALAGAGLATLVGLLLAATQPRLLARAAAAAFPAIVWQVDTREPLVALTFDDGPDPVFTPQVLESLARHEAHATFFLIGKRARQHPQLVRRIRRGGHEVANHTDSARATVWMTDGELADDLLRAEASLALASARTKLFRPGSGWLWPGQLAVAARHGYTCVLGSVYPFDPHGTPAGYIRWVIVRNLEPGAIVVLHDGGGDRSATVEAVGSILSAGHDRGLRFVTVSELLAARGG